MFRCTSVFFAVTFFLIIIKKLPLVRVELLLNIELLHIVIVAVVVLFDKGNAFTFFFALSMKASFRESLCLHDKIVCTAMSISIFYRLHSNISCKQIRNANKW